MLTERLDAFMYRWYRWRVRRLQSKLLMAEAAMATCSWRMDRRLDALIRRIEARNRQQKVAEGSR